MVLLFSKSLTVIELFSHICPATIPEKRKLSIATNLPMQCKAIFTAVKMTNFSRKTYDIFAQNKVFRAKIRKIMYTPVPPSFTIIEVGCKGVYITWTC